MVNSRFENSSFQVKQGVMATQYFKRNLLLNCIEKEKKSLVCFLLPLKRDKNVRHLQPISSIWRPLAFLPVTLSKGDKITSFSESTQWLKFCTEELCFLSYIFSFPCVVLIITNSRSQTASNPTLVLSCYFHFV